MTSTPISQAVAKRDNSPAALISQYRDDFALVLPPQVKVDTFVRVAQGALRRNKDLAAAAAKDPGSLMSALLEAARLGLEPGSDEYWLTPRAGAVLGIVGYRGELELVYRAGAVSSVIAEIVHENDNFTWRPGVDDRPQHEANWFGDRGTAIGAYAFAIMKDGAVSKVAVVGPADAKRAMESSATAKSQHSPWKTDYGAMLLKTAIHRLAKFLPTSAEYRREQLRAVAEVANVTDTRQLPPPVLDRVQVDDDGVIVEGEVIE